MMRGIFKKKFSLLKELKVSILTIIGFFLTIINPISWIAYLIIYKIGKIAGGDRNTVKITSQWFAFMCSIIIYIGISLYIIYKVNS